VLFDVLAKRTNGAFLSPNSRFSFFIELDEAIPITIKEDIEHGSRSRFLPEHAPLLARRVARDAAHIYDPGRSLLCRVQ
jgi:hypothetical protein